jgi:hypothetical protein
MERLEISAEAQSIFRQYVDGDLSPEELDRAFNRYFDCQYGPVAFIPKRTFLGTSGISVTPIRLDVELELYSELFPRFRIDVCLVENTSKCADRDLMMLRNNNGVGTVA